MVSAQIPLNRLVVMWLTRLLSLHYDSLQSDCRNLEWCWSAVNWFSTATYCSAKNFLKTEKKNFSRRLYRVALEVVTGSQSTAK